MTNEERSSIENIETKIKYPFPYKEDDGYINRNEYAVCKIKDLRMLLKLIEKQEEKIGLDENIFKKMAEHIYDVEGFIPGCSLYECNKNMNCSECIIDWAENEVKKDE